MTELPKSASVVTIGLGALGLGAAYEAVLGGAENVLAVSETKPGSPQIQTRQQFRMSHLTEAQNWGVDHSANRARALQAQAGITTSTQRPYIWLVDPSGLEKHRTLLSNVHNMGYDPKEEFVTREALRDIYPFVSGDNFTHGVIVNNAGRFFLGGIAEAMRVSAGEKLTYAQGTAQEVIFDRHQHVEGVRIDGQVVETKKVIIASGAFVNNLQTLVPQVDPKFLRRFSSTQRELYSGPTPDEIRSAPNAFFIAPSHADVVYQHGQDSSYEYIFPNVRPIKDPVENPTVDLHRRRKHPETGARRVVPKIIFDLLSGSMPLYGDSSRYLALRPTLVTAGYFPRYWDGGPVVDYLPGQDGVIEDVIVYNGGNYSGVQTMFGFGLIAADLALGNRNAPESIRSVVAAERPSNSFSDHTV